MVPDSEKDTTFERNGRLMYSEYGKGSGQLNTLLKGKDFWTDDYSLERRSLEMRINIER